MHTANEVRHRREKGQGIHGKNAGGMNNETVLQNDSSQGFYTRKHAYRGGKDHKRFHQS